MESTSARINPEAVRSYDLRGVVGRQLDVGDARQLGLAYATLHAGVAALGRIGVGEQGGGGSTLALDPEQARESQASSLGGCRCIARAPPLTPQLHLALQGL